MSRLLRIRLALIGLLLATLACNINATPPPDTGLLGTMIAQTIIASLTVNPPAATMTPILQATPTFVTETPTLTPTETLTFTPSFTFTPSLTFTPLTPMISVSVATNCRIGPGKSYPMVGALMVGETVRVYARDPSLHYWYIRNPDHQNSFCWVWDEYATVTGNIASLPIFTPIPTFTPTRTATPTITVTSSTGPSFTLSYAGLETCKARKRWWVQITIKNNGQAPFRSVTIALRDVQKNVTHSVSSDGFNATSGCNSPAHLDVLSPKQATFISSAEFANNLKGRQLIAQVILCTRIGQGGMCVQKALSFTP